MLGIKGLAGGKVGSSTIHLLVGEVEGGMVLPVTKVSARLESGVDEAGKTKNFSTARFCSSKSPFELIEYREVKNGKQPSDARRSSDRGESPDTQRLSGSSRS
jgi:hypothetical protein